MIKPSFSFQYQIIKLKIKKVFKDRIIIYNKIENAFAFI